MLRYLLVVYIALSLSAYSCKSTDGEDNRSGDQDATISASASPSPSASESSKPSPSDEPDDKKDPITASGTVKKGVEGGCWVIVLDSGKTILPTNLADEFKVEDLKVEVTYLPTIAFSYCMQGQAADIQKIERKN